MVFILSLSEWMMEGWVCKNMLFIAKMKEIVCIYSNCKKRIAEDWEDNFTTSFYKGIQLAFIKLLTVVEDAIPETQVRWRD